MSSALLVCRWMKKEQVAIMRKVKTHFEQVPVAVVKKIAVEEQEAEREQESDEKETRSPNLVVETPATKTEPYSVSSFTNCRNPASNSEYPEERYRSLDHGGTRRINL